MSEILIWIKLLSVSSFCFVVIVYLSLFQVPAYTKITHWGSPHCGLQKSISCSPNGQPRTGRLYHLISLRLRQFPEYPKLWEERIEAFRAQLTAFQTRSTGQPGELSRGRKRLVRIPLFLLFRALPKEFLHCDDVMWFTVILFLFFLLLWSFSLNFVMSPITPYSPVSSPKTSTLPTSEHGTWERRCPTSKRKLQRQHFDTSLTRACLMAGWI